MPQIIPIALAAGGAALSSVGSIAEGKSQSQTEKFNAAINRQQSGLIMQSAELDIQRQRKAKDRYVGAQRSGYSKAGVRVGTGSPLDVMADTLAEFELDEMITRYNAQIGASRQTSEADYRESIAKNYKRTGYLKAGTTLLSTGASLGMKYG